MDSILTAFAILAGLAGIATPIAYRRLYGGPWRLGDGFTTEFTGLGLSMMVTNPIGLLVSLGVSHIVPSSEVSLYATLMVLNIILGIVGGWIWVVIFIRPIKPQPLPES